jgi:thiol-disulfide isomerase/thioredoxin
MEWVSVSARLLLAGVFALAAATKLLDQPGVRETLRAFRVPARFVPAAALALPVGEGLVSVALLLTPTARPGGVLGALLLLTFMVGIAASMRRGERPDCHCFGQATSAPIGRGTLVRNAVLLAVAVVVAAAPSVDLWDWAGDRSSAELVALALGAVAIALGAVAINARGAQRVLDLEVERLRRLVMAGLPSGSPIPEVRLDDVGTGRHLSSTELINGDRAVIVFLSSDCEPCAALMPSIARWQRAFAGRLAIHAIGSGDPHEYRRMAERFGIERVLMDVKDSARLAFHARVTPSAVAIGPGGVVDGETAEGLQEVESLVRRANAKAAEPVGLA